MGTGFKEFMAFIYLQVFVSGLQCMCLRCDLSASTSDFIQPCLPSDCGKGTLWNIKPKCKNKHFVCKLFLAMVFFTYKKYFFLIMWSPNCLLSRETQYCFWILLYSAQGF